MPSGEDVEAEAIGVDVAMRGADGLISVVEEAEGAAKRAADLLSGANRAEGHPLEDGLRLGAIPEGDPRLEDGQVSAAVKGAVAVAIQ